MPRGFSYLGELARLEERGHANETDVVVPDDHILFVLAWYLVRVMEHCQFVRAAVYIATGDLLSNASRPVFSMKSFLSLLYGTCRIPLRQMSPVG